MARFGKILAAMLVALAPCAAFGDFEEALRAFERKDYAVALREFRTGAEDGHAGALYYLGRMYLMAEGVPADYKRAADLFTRAAVQGNTNAQYYLGVLYYRGAGVPQDFPMALKWFSAAAAQGDHIAQYTLGVMYASGTIVSHDDVLAYAWFTLAADNGDESAKKFREIMARRMSPSEISRAKQLAEEGPPVRGGATSVR